MHFKVCPQATEQDRELLKQKITTAEELKAVRNALTRDFNNISRDHREYFMNYTYGWDGCWPYASLDGDRFWMYREYLREYSGLHEQIKLWGQQPNLRDFITNKQFIHVSESDPELIAFTPDEDFGRRDVRVKSRLGKFLTKYHPYLNEGTVKDLATQFAAKTRPFTLHWAKGEDEIYHVYRHCTTTSCMSKERDYWGLKHKRKYVNPVAAYDSPDIGVAYIKDSRDRIVARTLVNRITNKYIRIYGNDHVMKEILREDFGIVEQGSLEGASLKRIDLDDGRIAWPYIDGGLSKFNLFEDKMTISQDGKYTPPGLSESAFTPLRHCSTCDSPVDKHAVKLRHTPEHLWLCGSCNAKASKEVWVIDGRLTAIIVHYDGWLSTLPENVELLEDRYGRTFVNTPWIMKEMSEVDGGWMPTRDTIVMHKFKGDTRTQTRVLSADTGSMIMVRDENGNKQYFDREQAEAGRFEDLVLSPLYKSWIWKENAVNAIYRADGHRTLVAKQDAYYHQLTDQWITREFVGRDVRARRDNEVMYDDQRTAIHIDGPRRPEQGNFPWLAPLQATGTTG